MHLRVLKRQKSLELRGGDAVRSLDSPGSIAIVLESGAGKSTLLNALLGHEALETGEVASPAGRRTTVASPYGGTS